MMPMFLHDSGNSASNKESGKTLSIHREHDWARPGNETGRECRDAYLTEISVGTATAAARVPVKEDTPETAESIAGDSEASE